MKKILGLILLSVVLIGCTTAEKQKVADITEKAMKTVEVGADIAAASGVPFAGAIAAATPFIGTTLLAFLGLGSQKRKKEALYQSTAAIHKEASYIVQRIKDGTMEINDLITILPTMVKDVSTVSHTSYGVYKEIKKDVNKFQAKGSVKKLS